MGGNTKIMVDLATVSIVPLKVGPETDITKEKEEPYSCEGASDFVYAYRVCEIHYGKDVHAIPYNRGDTFADGKDAEQDGNDTDGGDDDSDGDDKEGDVRILVEKIADSDYAGTNAPDAATTVELLGNEDQEQFIMAIRR
jgi:hypothetical protein